jgi:OOP family OmpA-OmpF porin
MKYVMKAIVAATVLMLGTTAAQADDLYLLGSAGFSVFAKAAARNPAPGESISAADVTWNIQLGYRFNPYFTVEGGYHHLGKTTYDHSSYREHREFEAYALSVDALAALPLGKRFSLFGKLGLAATAAKVSNLNYLVSGQGTSTTHSKFGLHYGAGLNWNISSEWEARTEYQTFQNVGRGDAQTNIHVLTVGVAYKF